MNKCYVTFRFLQFISRMSKKQFKVFQKSDFNNDYKVTTLNYQIENYKKNDFYVKLLFTQMTINEKKIRNFKKNI